MGDGALVDWDWDAFRRGEPTGGEAIALPRTGWGALIAFLAGPAAVHAVSQHPAEGRWSRADGQSGRRPVAAAELEEAEELLIADLSYAGVPPPPRGVEWRLMLPPGVSQEQFGERVNLTMDDSGYRPENARRTALKLRAELRSLLD